VPAIVRGIGFLLTINVVRVAVRNGAGRSRHAPVTPGHPLRGSSMSAGVVAAAGVRDG